MATVLDGLQRLSRTDSRFAGRLDAENAACTGMSFGGWTTAAFLETKDPRIKCAVLKCPSLNSSDGGRLRATHSADVPALVMVGKEDTVIGVEGNDAAKAYAATHKGPAAYLEIARSQRRRPSSSFLRALLEPPEPSNAGTRRPRLLHVLRALQSKVRERHRHIRLPHAARNHVRAPPHPRAARRHQFLRPRLPQHPPQATRPPAPRHHRQRIRRTLSHQEPFQPGRSRLGVLLGTTAFATMPIHRHAARGTALKLRTNLELS